MHSKSEAVTISWSQWQADLAWAAKSPSMVSLGRYAYSQPHSRNPSTKLNTEYSAAPQLNVPGKLKREPIRLSSRFLGPYFELLWSSLVKQSYNLQLLAQNVQIHSAGGTLGEFDFLLRPLREISTVAEKQFPPALIHQEVAVKFYLGLPGVSYQHAPSVWIGPNQQDRLDLKLHNMLSRQIKLSRLSGVRAKLAERAALQIRPDTVIKPEIVVKGYLFHPLQETLLLPGYINPQVLTGRWLSFSELIRLQGYHCQWVILPKLAWLSPTTAEYQALMSYQQLITAMNTVKVTGQPQLIAAMAGNKQQGIKEVGRYFIVNDNWQTKAEKTLKAKPLKNIVKYFSN